MKLALRGTGFALGLLALAVPARAARFECGDVIGPGGRVTVENDITGCTGTGLRIVGPVTVDLGNSFLICAQGTQSVGFVVEGRGVKMRGGHVVSCTVGVLLSGSNHRVTSIQIARTFVGLFADGANASRVEDSRFSDVQFGIDVAAGTERNQILDNQFETIGSIAIEVDGSRHRISGNEVDLADDAAYVVDGTRHLLKANRGRSLEVAYDVGGSGHRLIDNVALFTGDGSGLFDGTGFFVTGEQIALVRNVSRRNLGSGFLFQSLTSARAVENLAELNGDHGFLLQRVADSVLLKNTALSNFGGDGIHVGTPANGVLVRDNESTGHGAPRHDLRDDDLTCGGTLWQSNAFTRAFPACIR